MPLYTYYCPAHDEEVVRLVKIDERDNQRCDECGYRLVREIDRPGGVWAPTSGRGLAV